MDDVSDPNAPLALARRAATLRQAWRPAIDDRVSFLEERCCGKRVLDIGCVAHDAARMDSPQWLHRRLAAAAAYCLGVDVLPEGVDAMRRMGYQAIAHDLTEGLGPLSNETPFDLIIAGELIEHLEDLGMVFRTAAALLAPGGQLMITTPNPYAPHRVRAGQMGIAWENVDHVSYAFPSGIVELAERHGLVLAEAAVTDDGTRRRPADSIRAALRRLTGRQWATVGFATTGRHRVRHVDYGRLGRLLHGLWWPRRRFVGETFVYVVVQP